MNYFATFFTHSGAIKFSRFLTKIKIVNESCPVPRKLSSNCGIGVSFLGTGQDSFAILFLVKNLENFIAPE